jgi:urease accessory protein
VTRSALAATAGLTVEPAAGCPDSPLPPRIRWSQAWPVLIRRTGPAQVHLVHGAGGPLGGDDFALDITVAVGAALAVRSAAATVVQPGGGETASWAVSARVGAGGLLDWRPEPTVVCAGAALAADLRVRLEPGAGAVLREITVLGRHAEPGGRYRGELRVDVGGAPLLAHRTLLDGTDPELCGPAGTAGARAVGTLVWAGIAAADRGSAAEAGEQPGLRWASSDLAGPGRVLLAVGEPGAVIQLLDAATGQRRRSATTSDCGNTVDVSSSSASKCRATAGTDSRIDRS